MYQKKKKNEKPSLYIFNFCCIFGTYFFIIFTSNIVENTAYLYPAKNDGLYSNQRKIHRIYTDSGQFYLYYNHTTPTLPYLHSPPSPPPQEPSLLPRRMHQKTDRSNSTTAGRRDDYDADVTVMARQLASRWAQAARMGDREEGGGV